MKTVIRGARIVGPDKILKGDICIDEGRITALGKVKRPPGSKVIDARGLYALPGFIDLHTHGGLGFDATEGVFNPRTHKFNASRKAFRRALPKLMKRFARTGVTRALLATLAAPMSHLERALGYLADYVESDGNGRDGALLEGIFIEGTFIKNPAFAGAQNPQNFLRPHLRTFDALNRAARGHIRYVNVVPEHGKAAERLMRHLSKKDVLVGMGHTSCGSEQVRQWQDLGLRISVHFLNGPTGSSFKPFFGGNVVQAVLRTRGIYAELICDGWHSSPQYVMDIFRRKGADRIVAITDAVFAAGAKGICEFSLGGIRGKVHSSGEYLHTKHDPITLFGSVLDMTTAFGNILSWHTSHMSGIWYRRRKAVELDRALVRVAKCCATQPARVLGLHKRRNSTPGTGTLQTGKCADIVLVALEGKPGEYRLNVKHTFVAGRKVV